MESTRIAAAAGMALASASLLAGGARAQGLTERVSVDSSGVQGDHASGGGALSADGTVIAFESAADNLVTGDLNLYQDVFVRDRVGGTTGRVSVDSNGAESDGDSFVAALSADGRVVLFSSYADNLVAGDGNHVLDVFVHDLASGATERVSVDSSGAEANGASQGVALSADGNLVAFYSYASNLVAGDANGAADVFVHDRTTGATERISVDSGGAEADGASFYGLLSADGSKVAFLSYATNLVAGDANGAADVFLRDRAAGTTVRVSVDSSGSEADAGSAAPAISADGTVVAFHSDADNLVAGDTNGKSDVFVRDLAAGTTARVSVGPLGAEAHGSSLAAFLSSDGTVVLFTSGAADLVFGDTNVANDVFVHDRLLHVTERVSVGAAGVQADQGSRSTAISADGMLVAFSSDADNLVVGDTNAATDQFVHERCTGAAGWSNYGSGVAGTLGVPTFTAQSNPVLGQPVTVDLSNSSGVDAFGLLFLGLSRASIHSSFGGDLLVLPILVVPMTVPLAGLSLTGTLPNDPRLCSLTVDLQVFEDDAGAKKHVSTTTGLELVLGL
jgi:Tol biopolymer transport system component